MLGTVKLYDDARSFGFIVPDGGGGGDARKMGDEAVEAVVPAGTISEDAGGERARSDARAIAGMRLGSPAPAAR